MSKPQVTITLGRTGQKVVKRPRTITDDESRPSSGSKRSIRERLGSNANGSLLSKNKRQRGNGLKWSPGNNGVDDAPIGRNDLRFKLMRKNLSRRRRSDVEERRKLDPCENRSGSVRSPMRVNMLRHMPEPKESSLLRRIPPSRSADDLLQVDSLRKSLSSWNLDGLRRRTPDKILKTYRGISPPRNIDVLRQVPLIRSIDASRARFFSDDLLDPSRPTGSMPIRVKATPESAKSVAPTSGIMQRNSYTGEEPVTVASLLHSLGLGKYAILFQAEEVDMTALKQMRDNDLKELGIPMGPRKKILLAMLPRSKRQPP